MSVRPVEGDTLNLERTQQESSDSFIPEAVTADDTAEDLLTPAELWRDSLIHFPGPGLLEACGWVVLFFVFQVVFGAAVFLGMIIANGARNQQAIESLLSDRMDLFLGLTTFLTYLALIPVGWLRMGAGASLKLNFSAPTLAQFLLVLSLVMPLGAVADVLFVLGETVLEQVLGADLAALQQDTDIRTALEKLQDSPLWVLVLVVAVLPAVGEEFLFRGLIGRGLINRYGIIFGVVVTSIFFACVHMYPPHVLAILPVGFVIHYVYLSTRSYWMPMLFHFANNTLAVVGLKYGAEGEQPWWMAIAGGAYVVVGLWGLWLIRTRYVSDSELTSPVSDDRYNDGDMSGEQVVRIRGAEAPPPGFPIHRRAPVAVGITILALLMLTLQSAMLWVSLSEQPEVEADQEVAAWMVGGDQSA